MKLNKAFSKKFVMAVLSGAMLLPLATITTANAGSYVESQAYNDPNFQANKQKAISLLTARGYQIIDIDVDDYRGKAVFEVEAIKNNREYDIVLAYPSLEIIKERVDF